MVSVLFYLPMKNMTYETQADSLKLANWISLAAHPSREDLPVHILQLCRMYGLLQD